MRTVGCGGERRRRHRAHALSVESEAASGSGGRLAPSVARCFLRWLAGGGWWTGRSRRPIGSDGIRESGEETRVFVGLGL